MFNPYSRCGCCDQVLSSRQPMLKKTGEVDDLCAACRHVVNKAVHYHDEDVYELEREVWRSPMGLEEGETGYRDAESYYTG